jgi:valyl-tRNA synthetase
LLIIDGKRPNVCTEVWRTGKRIYANSNGSLQPSDDNSWIVERCEEDAMETAKKMADGRPFTIEQDEDVLDTWFSAGLWPFAIQGWPDKVSRDRSREAVAT